MRLHRLALACLSLAALGLVSGLYASSSASRPEVIVPEARAWSGPPQIPALESAWLLGAEDRPGLYVLRVRLRKDGRIPPHRHPDDRHTTVLSGVLYVGFGDRWNEREMVEVRAGQLYVAPAGMPHFVWAKDGDAEYQESGSGPTATSWTADGEAP